MKYLVLVGLMGLAGFVGGCSCNCMDKDKDKHDHAKMNSADSPKMMCIVEKEHEADPKVTYEYKGKTYHFCCKDCVAEFKKDPEKYSAAK